MSESYKDADSISCKVGDVDQQGDLKTRVLTTPRPKLSRLTSVHLSGSGV